MEIDIRVGLMYGMQSFFLGDVACLLGYIVIDPLNCWNFDIVEKFLNLRFHMAHAFKWKD